MKMDDSDPLCSDPPTHVFPLRRCITSPSATFVPPAGQQVNLLLQSVFTWSLPPAAFCKCRELMFRCRAHRPDVTHRDGRDIGYTYYGHPRRLHLPMIRIRHALLERNLHRADSRALQHLMHAIMCMPRLADA